MKTSEEEIELVTPDNEKIVLWKISQERNKKNIFMTHGTFSDKKICLVIAKYLSKKGYNSWILEWRNHGKSPKTQNKFNFETIALNDLFAVFDYLTNTLKIEKMSCITHSGGGICLTIFLIRFPLFQNCINSATMFSCQAFSVNFSIKNYFKLVFSKFFSFILGYIPGKALKLGTQNETYYTMKQWFNWNLENNFIGENYDYFSDMSNVKIPIYNICSEGDKFISPPKSCEIYLKSFKNSNNVYKCFGLKYGNLEEYGHGRIILSKNSVKEVFPTVLKWLEDNE